MTLKEFKKAIRKIRLANKNSWWFFSALVAGKAVSIKAFGPSLGSGHYRIDGRDWTPGYGDESIKYFNASITLPFSPQQGQ